MPQHHARPILEPLEAREVPAALATLTDSGRTLMITGDAAANSITVTQNDRARTLTVVGTAQGPTVFQSADIRLIVANLGAGNDRFEFRTAGHVSLSRQLRIDLGIGDDTAVVRWADDHSTASAGLTALISGQAGSDAVGIRIGQLATGVTVTVGADGGAGNDALLAETLFPVRAATLDVGLRGGAGNDDIQLTSTGKLAVGGRANYTLDGEAGDDTIVFDGAGQIIGSLTIRASGGAGNDQVALTSTGFTGPTRPRVALLGGEGDDTLLALARATTTHVLVDGGAGTDAALVPGDARLAGVEQSRPPSFSERLTGPALPFYPILPTATVTRNGRTTEYWTAGKSAPGQPVVVLFAGYGNTLDTWANVSSRLAARYQVIAVNRPGYGRSSLVPNFSGTDVVEQTRAIVKQLAGNRPVVLVGHSLGGTYADLYARLHPDEVAGVVFNDSSVPEQFALAPGGFPPDSPDARLLPSPGMVPEGQAFERIGQEVFDHPSFPAVPVINLLSMSPQDYAQSPGLGELYQKLGDLGQPGETRYVAGTGHYIHFNQPAAFLSAVNDVVRQATQLPSRTTLTADTGTGLAGDRVVLTATLQGTPSATGNVVIKVGSTVLGTASVLQGKAVLATSQLSAASSQVTAEYSGDRKFLPSRATLTVRLTAPSAESQFIASVLADAATRYGIPGLSAAVVLGNRVVTGAAGTLAAGSTTPVSMADTFHNGSTTKAMTATLAGVLIDQHRIRWDTTLAEVFPTLRDTMRPEYRAVTLEQLLQHRAGIIADEDASTALSDALAAMTANPTGDPKTLRRQLLPLLLNEPPANAVGTFHYSNAGYTLAAIMMEQVTGQAYETLLGQNVFEPLGMASATFTAPSGLSPLGHDEAGQPVPYESDLYQGTDSPIVNPAGANLRMSVADWAKFIQAHLGQTVNGVQLLTAQTLARLHTPAFADLPANDTAQNYAAGWLTRPAGFGNNDPSLGASIDHDGSDGFWLAEVEAYPTAEFAVLVMTNTAFAADGEYLGTAAYADIKARLTERFAPKQAPTALPLSQTVRDTLQGVRAETGVPALAAGVIVNGQTVGLAAIGLREATSSATISDDARFHLGSSSKSMTATLAAILVERGIIRWDTTVGQLFSEIRDQIRPEYASVTLEELLNHRGGFGDFTNEADVSTYQQFQRSARYASEGRQSYLRYWLTSIPGAVPRGEFHYSNIGYTLAGAMLERASQRGFEQLLRENVFQPLGMTSAVFSLPTSTGAQGQPFGHDENGAPIHTNGREPLDLLSPSGGVSMTMADWAKYLRMQLGQPVNGVRLLSAASLTKLHTPDSRTITDDSGTYRYGFGWRTAETPLGEALGHEGAVPGFYSRVGILPSLGIAVFSAVSELSETAVAANEALTTALLGAVG